MPKTTEECIKTVEKQIELALGGFEAKIYMCSEEISYNVPVDEKRESIFSVFRAAEAIADLYEQLDDMREEMKMMSEVSQ